MGAVIGKNLGAVNLTQYKSWYINENMGAVNVGAIY